MNQLALGNLTDDVTLLGTAAQVAMGLLNLDLPMDVRDLTYDLTNWEWTGEHVAQTLLDAVGLLPAIGSVKYIDDALRLLPYVDTLKYTDEYGTLAKGADKLGDMFGSGSKTADLLKNAPEFDDLLKNTDEFGILAKRADDANAAAENFIEKAVKAQNKYVDNGVNSMNDLIDTNIAGKKAWYKADGTINMPPNNGAVLGTKEITDLQPGKRLGRYGGYTKNSDFLAEAGSSADRLSLPPSINTSIYQEFEVLKPIPRVTKSLVEPWGTSAGWGIQFKMPFTIEDLIREGYLK